MHLTARSHVSGLDRSITLAQARVNVKSVAQESEDWLPSWTVAPPVAVLLTSSQTGLGRGRLQRRPIGEPLCFTGGG